MQQLDSFILFLALLTACFRFPASKSGGRASVPGQFVWDLW